MAGGMRTNRKTGGKFKVKDHPLNECYCGRPLTWLGSKAAMQVCSKCIRDPIACECEEARFEVEPEKTTMRCSKCGGSGHLSGGSILYPTFPKCYVCGGHGTLPKRKLTLMEKITGNVPERMSE